MTKQEEIIDKLAEYLYQWNGAVNGDWTKLGEHQKDDYRQPVIVDVLPMLDSQGVVIKVEKGSPFVSMHLQLPAVKKAVELMLKASYVAVESLIEEK